MGLGLARAGDIFLSFIGDKLHINIAYKNHSGFVSCFMLRLIELDNPLFILKDFGLRIKCQKALIEPDFSELAKKRVIILKCTLKNVTFLSGDEKIIKSDDFPASFENGPLVLFDKLNNIVYDTIWTELGVYNEKVRFSSYQANSKDVKIWASGTVEESGNFNIRVKGFFSPEIVAGVSQELIGILTQESRGWLSYSINVASDKDKSLFKLDSDRFKLDFKKIEAE